MSKDVAVEVVEVPYYKPEEAFAILVQNDVEHAAALKMLVEKAESQKSVSSPVILRLVETMMDGLVADAVKLCRLKGAYEKIQRTVKDHEHLKNKKAQLAQEYSILNQKLKALRAEIAMDRNQWQEDKYFMEEEIRKLKEENDSLNFMIEDMMRPSARAPKPKHKHKKGVWQ